MATCPYYRSNVTLLRADNANVPASPPIFWCTHSHSPVSLLLASNAVGEAQKLKCGGDLNRCHIPLEHRPPSWLANAP